MEQLQFDWVKEKIRRAKGEGEVRKVPRVIMTDGRKFVFNKVASLLIVGDENNPEGYNVDFGIAGAIVGFKFKKSGQRAVVLGDKTITAKSLTTRGLLPENLRTGKFVADVAWSKENMCFYADFSDAVKVAKKQKLTAEEREAKKIAAKARKAAKEAARKV